MLLKLPMVFIAGIKIKELDQNSCETQIRFKYLNQNPFKSIYFACLGMAAELSTGAIAMMNVYGHQPKVSMLVTGMNAEFYKKAIGKITFICEDGKAIEASVQKAIKTSEGQSISVESQGINENGEMVCKFNFTWSFKSKTKL